MTARLPSRGGLVTASPPPSRQRCAALPTLRAAPPTLRAAPRATQVNDERNFPFEQFPFAGIVGLCLPSIAAAGTVPLLDNIMAQRLLPANMFSFYLSPLGDTSAIIFGGGTEVEEASRGPFRPAPSAASHPRAQPQQRGSSASHEQRALKRDQALVSPCQA